MPKYTINATNINNVVIKFISLFIMRPVTVLTKSTIAIISIAYCTIFNIFLFLLNIIQANPHAYIASIVTNIVAKSQSSLIIRSFSANIINIFILASQFLKQFWASIA